MDRNLDKSLTQWATKEKRKPLLLRGARQTGKTFAVRKLGTTFKKFIEINFEREPRFASLFEGDLLPDKLIQNIGALRQLSITPGDTLLFLDEIQNCPWAVVALRYFFEVMPELHVIGAGSLLEFEFKNISVPVGRIEFLYVRPLTFSEYLKSSGKGLLAEEIDAMGTLSPLHQALHEECCGLLREYLYVGGMPGVVAAFLSEKSIKAAEEEQRDIIQTYRADFAKYAGRTGVEQTEKVFSALPGLVGNKTVFSQIDPDARAYQVKAALDILMLARVAVMVRTTSGSGVPLAAGASEKYFKTIFLDVGLMQRVQGVTYEEWYRTDRIFDCHRGSIAEQYVGQELMHRQTDHEEPGLFYWHRLQKGALAEVDYLCEAQGHAIPVEVKSGTTGHMRSMHQYFVSYPLVPGGIKCSLAPVNRSEKIINVPLYAAHRIMEFAQKFSNQ